MGECDDGGCLVVDFGDFEHQLLQTRISVVTLPTPSMVRCGGNSNAHWVVVFVEAYGGGEVLPKGKIQCLWFNRITALQKSWILEN